MQNNEYTLEKCSLYDVKFIKDIPIVLFKEHNMALPVWGTYSSRLGSLLNLVTFDFHTDTHNAFNSYLMDKDISIEYGESVLQKPLCHGTLPEHENQNQMQLPIWQLHYTQRPIIFWELRTMRSTITRFAV